MGYGRFVDNAATMNGLRVVGASVHRGPPDVRYGRVTIAKDLRMGQTNKQECVAVSERTLPPETMGDSMAVAFRINYL